MRKKPVIREHPSPRRNASKIAARFIIHDPSDFSARGVKQIAAWMRRTAAFLERKHKEMAKTFKATYYYADK